MTDWQPLPDWAYYAMFVALILAIWIGVWIYDQPRRWTTRRFLRYRSREKSDES